MRFHCRELKTSTPFNIDTRTSDSGEELKPAIFTQTKVVSHLLEASDIGQRADITDMSQFASKGFIKDALRS